MTGQPNPLGITQSSIVDKQDRSVRLLDNGPAGVAALSSSGAAMLSEFIAGVPAVVGNDAVLRCWPYRFMGDIWWAIDLESRAARCR